jgi:DNA-binding MarR family transcriptional regulator
VSDQIETLLESSATFDSKITVIRGLILILVSYFRDGLQYRELRNVLKISDGKLASNLEYLSEMNYIKKEEIEINHKKLIVYFLTEQGRQEVKKISSYMELAIKVIKEGGMNHAGL